MDINYEDVWKKLQKRAERTGRGMAEIIWDAMAISEHEAHERENIRLRAKLAEYNERCKNV